MKTKRLVIFADGASQGNPGPAAIGVVIKDEQGKPITGFSQAIGPTTSNQAEYRAITAALEKAISLGADSVDLRSDSQLVVRQLNGQYRVKKAALRPLYLKVKQLQGQLQQCTVTHIPRQQNREADRLANLALR